ncbi:MAG: hypothetical protein QNJ69_06380 [Gammaproteobacteria bacterium]|nr:hypothetical protein [Gammaproteobacteria bacterium]
MKILTSFIGFILAIVVAIIIFAPERLPVGYGFEPVPVELVVENTLTGQLVESMTGKSGKNVVVTNTSDAPLNNLTVSLLDSSNNIKHQHIEPKMPASGKVTLGWVNNWTIDTGDQLEVKASGFYKVLWAL